MQNNEITLLFRKPYFPVIIIYEEQLYSVKSLNVLVNILLSFNYPDNIGTVKMIDSTAEEFWFMTQKNTLIPGLLCKRWTKKQIINLYNNYCEKNNIKSLYSLKSISNKKLKRIVNEISDLLRNN